MRRAIFFLFLIILASFASAEIIDYHNVVQNDAMYGGGTNYFGASKFRHGTSGTYEVETAQVRILKTTGFTGTQWTVEIQTDSGGNPSGTAVTDATSTRTITVPTYSSNFYNDAEWYNFTFASNVTLTAGTSYWLVVKGNGDDKGRWIWASPKNATHEAKYTTNGGTSWTAANYIANYYLYSYESPPTPTVENFQIQAKSNRTLSSVNVFSAKIFNNTDILSESTTNGTVFFDIIDGNYTINITGNGYAFFTANLSDISNNDTYIAYLYENNTIQIYIFDGKSFDPINFTNISYQVTGNNTGFYQEGETDTGELYLNDLDADIYSLEFFKLDLYPEQEYFVTLADNEYKELDVFLINNTYIATTIITLVDPYDIKIEGATITMQEEIEGSYVTVSQKETDSTGRARFYLKDDETYRAIISKTGYDTRTATITPVTNPYEVTLRIDPELSYEYTTPTLGISYFIEPSESYLEAKNISFNMTIASPDGLLSWFAVKHLGNISNVTASPSGGTTGFSLNLTDYTGYITIEYLFKATSQSLFARNVSYYIANFTYSNSTLTQGTADLKDDFSPLWRILIIVGSAIVLMFVAFELGMPAESHGFILTGVSIFFSLPSIAWIPAIIPVVVGILSILGAYVSITQRGGL